MTDKQRQRIKIGDEFKIDKLRYRIKEKRPYFVIAARIYKGKELYRECFSYHDLMYASKA